MDEVLSQTVDPFSSTKAVGKGTGPELGYAVVEAGSAEEALAIIRNG